MMILEEILKKGIARLREAEIDNASVDAWILMEYCFQISRSKYYINAREAADDSQCEVYFELISKRGKHIPLQYLTGVQEFMGIPFCVNENVLIPRQDTEILVEEVLKHAKNKSVLDLCTGSGCIIISLEVLCHLRKASGADISKKALETAEKNALFNHAKVTWIQSDLFEKIEDTYDIIVSNPPYIESHEIFNLMEEVKEHEPILALDGKENGLFFYQKIIEDASRHLTENGTIFFEIGYNQGQVVADLLKEANFRNINIVKDLTGLDRVVWAERKENRSVS